MRLSTYTIKPSLFGDASVSALPASRWWHSNVGVRERMALKSEWGFDDMRSEIGPDDSASNVSHNRRRKAHRARERRTPAPVEEESEEESTLAERIRRRIPG
jgi:hypothetical protein